MTVGKPRAPDVSQDLGREALSAPSLAKFWLAFPHGIFGWL